MTNPHLKLIVFATVSSAAIAMTAVDFFKLRRFEQKQRESITKNKNLDMLAFAYADAKMREEIASGRYTKSIAQMDEDYRQELEFQMIAVRINE